MKPLIFDPRLAETANKISSPLGPGPCDKSSISDERTHTRCPASAPYGSHNTISRYRCSRHAKMCHHRRQSGRSAMPGSARDARPCPNIARVPGQVSATGDTRHRVAIIIIVAQLGGCCVGLLCCSGGGGGRGSCSRVAAAAPAAATALMGSR